MLPVPTLSSFLSRCVPTRIYSIGQDKVHELLIMHFNPVWAVADFYGIYTCQVSLKHLKSPKKWHH